MSYEKSFVLKILNNDGITPTHIKRANISGQKKVFFITVDGVEYVFKMIEITPNEEYEEYDNNTSEIEEYEADKDYILKEKIARIKNELDMAKNCKILPQLKLIDSYRTFCEDDEYFMYYIEEKFEGVPLNGFYKRGIFDIERTLDFICQMVKLIEIMYNSQYIHRDIKPSNIILNNNEYKIIDGGLCKNLADELHLTRTPDFIGTYRYAAPEQSDRISNFNWDFTTDLFPVGIIAIELFIKDARSYNEEHLRDMDYIYSKWKSDDDTINHVFSKLIVRLCNKSIARRFNSFDEIYDIIEKIKKGEII